MLFNAKSKIGFKLRPHGCLWTLLMQNTLLQPRIRVSRAEASTCPPSSPPPALSCLNAINQWGCVRLGGWVGGVISALPSTGWINIKLEEHTNLDRQSQWAYPTGQLRVCWFVPTATMCCWQITCLHLILMFLLLLSFLSLHQWPSAFNSSLGLSSPAPPHPLSRRASSFSRRSPAIASSCGPHRARLLALTWQVPGLRTTASTNTFPTWGTKRRRWVDPRTPAKHYARSWCNRSMHRV